MVWYAFLIACFTSHCANMNWIENFESLTQCNETLPFIHAEVVGSGLKIEEIGCRKKGVINVKRQQSSSRRRTLPE